MPTPKIVAREPVVVELEAGDHWWCSCGRSARHPSCDGTHKGTGLAPVRFHLSETRKVALCQCKATRNPPFCDGSHSGL